MARMSWRFDLTAEYRTHRTVLMICSSPNGREQVGLLGIRSLLAKFRQRAPEGGAESIGVA